jgi:hypothetical protein
MLPSAQRAPILLSSSYMPCFPPLVAFCREGFRSTFFLSVLYVTNRKQACFVQFRKGFSGSSWHPVVRFDASLVFITFALAIICDLLSSRN